MAEDIRLINALNNNSDNDSSLYMHHYWTNFSVEVVVLVVSVQTFDVELTSITQGAVIGTDHCVRIGILPSDSSAGVFSITPHQVTAFSRQMQNVNTPLLPLVSARALL